MVSGGTDFLTTILRLIGELFRSIPWERIYNTVHDIFVVLDAAIIIGIIIVLPIVLKYRHRFYTNPLKAYLRQTRAKKKPLVLPKAQFASIWQKILKKAVASPPQSLSLGIIEADSFVDEVLKYLKVRGEHMADRLEELQAENIGSLDRVWRAHKLRNELVHTPGFKLSATDAKRAFDDYETFLKELGVI